jgi:transposase
LEDPDMKILAIDLGKRRSVGCNYEADGTRIGYVSVDTTPQALHDLIVKSAPDRVVIEVGPQAGWVHDLVTSLEIEIEVANPSHEAWRWRKVRNKSDRKDALKCARLSASNQLPTVHMPSRDVRDWRESIAYRCALRTRRTAIKNSIRAILTRLALPMANGSSAWTKKSLAYLHELATIDDGELWRASLAEELIQLETVERSITRIERELERRAHQDERVALLRTIPGVGPRLSETIVAVIDEPRRFRRSRQVASYVGLTPRQFQSGSMDRQGRISGQGHRLLRSLLVQVAWLGLRNNPWMREVYERVRRGTDSRKKIAIIAVARRLLIRCWAMLRDGTRWRDAGRVSLRLAA